MSTILVPPPTPIEAIRFVMEQKGLKNGDLIPFLGSRPRVSEILNGKRRLTLKMIRSLNSGLGIPAEILIQDPATILPPIVSEVDKKEEAVIR